MESKELRTFENWFKKLNQRFDDTNRKIENRHTALLNVCTNIRREMATVKDLASVHEVLDVLRKEVGALRKDLDGFRDKYEARLATIELAFSQLESRLLH